MASPVPFLGGGVEKTAEEDSKGEAGVRVPESLCATGTASSRSAAFVLRPLTRPVD